MDGLPPYLVEPPAYIKEGSLYVPKRPAIQLPSEKRGTFPMPFFIPILYGDASVSYTDVGSDSTDASSYTFSAKSIGAAPGAGETRHIIVAAITRRAAGDVDISTVSVAGNSATEVHDFSWGSYNEIGFWSVEVSTGTTGDVVVTTNATAQRCAVYVFRAINLNNATVVTDVDTDTVSSNSQSASVWVRSGGIILSACESATVSTTTMTISGTGITDHGSVSFEGRASAASGTYSAQQTVALTGTYDANAQCGLVGISMR